jgi:nucleotide-binding universal stress UspA family protein
MAIHGRSVIKRFFLGFTAERLVRGSPYPVLLVPARAGVPLAEETHEAATI